MLTENIYRHMTMRLKYLIFRDFLYVDVVFCYFFFILFTMLCLSKFNLPTITQRPHESTFQQLFFIIIIVVEKDDANTFLFIK